MDRKYFVSHEGQQLGPYSADQIVGLVQKGNLTPLDYLYDEGKSDWVLFLEHDEVSARVRELKPKAPPKVVEGDKADHHRHKVDKPSFHKSKYQLDASPVGEFMNHEWFVLKGENKFGPFSYTDVVKMLQQGVVFEFDFAWHNGLGNWERIAELPAFAKENIRKLKDTLMPEISEVFFRRRHRRVSYGGTILIHDNKKVWKGSAVEISEGGAGVIMENALVVPGQELYLHFKPGDGVPPFNAICEVVSKKYVSEIRETNAAVKYGLKFKKISSEAQKLLQDFVKEAKAS